MAISQTKTITDISLFDFMKCFFTDHKTYLALTNKAKSKHIFMFYRFMSIMYPVQMHAVNGIHDIRLIDQLHKSFCKPNARSPKWLYTKSETPKKISDSIDVDKDLLEKYRQFMKIDPKSLDFMIQFMPDVVIDECNKFKQDIENAPKTQKIGKARKNNKS